MLTPDVVRAMEQKKLPMSPPMVIERPAESSISNSHDVGADQFKREYRDALVRVSEL
jgi:hypothetical protein